MQTVNVLMCCSDLSVQGGMVSVLKNYIEYKDWGNYHITYIPTHVEKNKIMVAFFFLRAYIKIFFSALRGKYDIAHLHTAERGSFYRKAIIASTLKHFGVKVIFHHHAAEFEEFFASLPNGQKRFVVRMLKRVDLNIVLSERLKPMILDKAPGASVEVLYNAVPVYNENPYNKSGNGILFLGRLGNRKGTYDLLYAIKKIQDMLPENTCFYLCGDGEVSQVKERIKELGLTKYIAHVGWIKKEEKKQIYKNIILHVLPSYNEGLPMSILETMAYGIPNISTRIASIPEVIEDGKNGYLIEPGDVDTLAKRLAELIYDQTKRIKFSEKSYDLIMERFSMDSNICRLKDFYQELLR